MQGTFKAAKAAKAAHRLQSIAEQQQNALLRSAINVWERMDVPRRTAFVKFLAADTSVELFTEDEARKRFGN